MDNEEKRRSRALEAGREMLEAYKLKHSNRRFSKSLEQASDEESFRNEAENQSIDLRSVSNNESILSRDITYSSVSMSEGEGDGDLEGLAGRVTELEELLQGKEAVVEALHAEIDHLRADASSPTSSHSQNSNNPYKDVIVTYRAKLQEFDRALNQRDNLIEDLTTSLQQALASRDALLAQISVLNSTQLGNPDRENICDEKISALENVLSIQKELVTQLSSQLEQAEQNVKRLEHEKEVQNTELVDYKDQIENLNKKIQSGSTEIDNSISDAQQVQKQYEKIKKDMEAVINGFKAETSANNAKHASEIKELSLRHEAELQKLRDENHNLETHHAKEMSVFQTQLTNYKRTIESLKLDLVTRKETHAKDKELLTEQIKLHKLQLDEMTTKYIATTSVLDSKESIERSLEQALNDAATLRTENESLKFKLDDLSSRYSAAQSLIENNQVHERTLSNKIFTLEKSLSRLSGISFAELDQTAYQTLDEMSLQYQITKQKLEEKAVMEKELVQKIQDLQDLVSKTRTELESANLAKESYEKQIKDMKNTCDRLKSEMNSTLEHQQQRFSADSLEVTRMPSCEFEQEILELKKTIEKRDEETAEYIKKLEELGGINQRLVEESQKLKNGLATAYAQCAVFEEKLDQTLGFGESKLDDTSALMDQTASSNGSTFDLEEVLHKQSNYNKVLLKLDSCRKQLEDFERERAQMLHKLEELTKEKEDILKEKEELLVDAKEKEEQHREEIKILKMEATAESKKFRHLLSNFEEGNEGLKQLKIEMEEKHAKEMEELRTYFEQKCLQMEKQYSEEVFSQQSKKMSDNDSEIEELNEDLYVGSGPVELSGGGDALGVLEKEIKSDSFSDFKDKKQNNVSEEKIAQIAAEYEEKLENLRKQLQEVKEKSGRTILLKAVNQFCQTEQSSTAAVQESCNELNKLRADYNRQLEEQVGLARIDIINALQEQIEALITVESESDENWPTELLELRNKFTSNTKREIQALRERHVQEIKCLREESNKIINGLHDEIKIIKAETRESLQSNLIKERDILHKTCATLKGLVSQLIGYFADCEEELNNTIISEVLKKQSTPRMDSRSVFECEQSAAKIKRVHFAPKSNEIASIVGSDTDLHDLINSEKDVMKILKNELEASLQRLRADSAKILNTSFSDSESWSTGLGDSPRDKLIEVEKLLAAFQEENEHLKVKVIELQQRVIMAENKKEVISEGYGEQDESVLEEVEEDFSQLQDRAKYVVMNGCNDTVYLLQLIDELCRHADKSIDDIKREKEDLQHQVSLVPTPTPNIHKVRKVKIEAADKQLRSTRKFQEEQAVEREAEREEATKQIKQLQERLRELEREKDRDYREYCIDSAESALSPASSSAGSSTLRQIDESEIDVSMQMHDLETKKLKTESELEAAVEKIWELREVIRELEQQVTARVNREDVLSGKIKQLEEVVVAQTKNQEELVQELEVLKSGNDNNQLSDHIGHLQEELRKHQLSSEQLTANSSALKQLRLEIRELQSQLDRKTRELESMHVCGSSLSLSQPSEDVSIREQIDAARCPTPDDPTSPPILPLDHVLKLKETLLKHFRAEDVALKRLKDLDIQLSSLQRQNEELLAEQEILQQTTSEQLFQIETLRARLEQQKQNAPFAQRQATSRLETQLYEINDRLEITERALNDKDIELAEVKDQLERVSRLLAEKETEIANVVQSENDVLQKLKNKLEILEEENHMMQAKLNNQEKTQTNMPQLIDTMLTDKNNEIDHLREQLMQREKQLEVYFSIDEAQLRELLRHNEHQKNSARTLSDILSINSECEEVEAIREAPNYTRQNVSNFKIPNSIIHSSGASKRDVVDFSQGIVDTPKVPMLELDSHSQCSDAIGSNNEISKDMDNLQMHPHEQVSLARVSPTPDTDAENQNESTASEDHDGFVCPRHGKVNNSTRNVEETVLNETITVQRIQELEAHLHEIKEELGAKSVALNQRDAELLEIQSHLEQLQENIESLNEDRLYYKSEYEKTKESELKIQRDLEEVENTLKKKTEELEDFKEKIQVNEKILTEEAKRCKRSEATLQEKLKEITNLKEIISEKDITIETLQARNTEIDNENKELYEYRRKLESYQQEITECQNEIQRLSEGLNSRDQMIRRLEEMARRSSLSGGSSPSEKDQEIFHLQEYLKEKDKVIRQMSDDSKSLHRALETIQSKMKESGNVVELRRKLKDERRSNVELTEEIAKLRTEVEMLSSSRRAEEDNDIAEMVQRELNLSARLDQQLLNVIDSEPEDRMKRMKCNDLKQANKEIDELNRFKDDLEIEREMLRSQIAEYENRIMQLKGDAEEESLRIAKMEEELARERHLVRSLQLQLQREKNSAEENKVRDTELISLLRIKLDEALEVRDRLLMEQKSHEVMNTLKDQNRKDIPDFGTEFVDFEKQRLELAKKLEAEQHKYAEAQEIIKKLESEKDRIQKQYELAEAEIEKLTSSLDLADCVKDQMKSDLRKAREELKAKNKECDWQKSILKTMSEADSKRNQQRTSDHSELKNLRRELKNAQEVINDFEADMKTLKEQLSESAEREAQLSRCIETLTDKETELTEQLSAAKAEDKKLRDIIADQQNELQLYLRREIELSEELKRERLSPNKNNSPSKVLQRVKDLNSTIERLSQEKVHLYEKISHLREENERYLDQIRFLETQLSLKNKGYSNAVSRNDTEEKLQHFYGKYLRSDSRRKALIYQKHYLVCIIAGYQLLEENTFAFLAQLTQTQRTYARRGMHRHHARVRFRSAVLVVISLQRMKWLILRWRTGRRVGANVVLGNIERPAITQPIRHRSAGAMTGHSPPVKERATTNGTSAFSHDPYFRRLTDIQQSLHLRVPESSTDNFKSD
ncbi:centromere-associated protein E isoform X3 [Nasonia vitripennis]|uniref:Pericentrin/AKAP-450 centrosomal targeting domain-containing protein n=1 Tax=Nasonia vitripennis TaxID=7425 RepID=A0A7M7QU99_NASVI|nr:centromere-associated protein E isoform X3 [Nasonia vitripennis]